MGVVLEFVLFKKRVDHSKATGLHLHDGPGQARSSLMTNWHQ